MSVLHAIVLFFAGMAAGGINAMVGSGTLITFPTLLFLGYPPLTANVSNNIGILAGGLGGIRGYRAELEGHISTVKRLAPASIAGAITGSLLLFVLPASAFSAIVPVLIALALVLVVTGPRLQAWARSREAAAAPVPESAEAGGVAVLLDDRTPDDGGPSGLERPGLALAGVFVAGAYGGYFGAAQGVLLLGIMGVLIAQPLQRINGFKNVLGTLVNFVASVVFLFIAWDHIDWAVVVCIAAGAVLGGYGGARLGRRLPPNALRGVIVVVGVVAIVKIVFFD